MFVSLERMNKGYNIVIYTDGSCNWKTRLGGIGIYMKYKDKEWFYNKGYANTTIDRCELRAILYALRLLKKDFRGIITFFIDRKNLVDTIKRYYIEWCQYGVYEGMNSDLWLCIFQEIKLRPKLTFKFLWIRGHQKVANIDVIGNTIADELANYKQFTEYEQDIIE